MSDVTDPQQAALVTCRSKGRDNIITLAWHTTASFDPHLYAIFVGAGRFSHGMIKDSKVFCVNFMPAELAGKVEYCGTHSGRRSDKFSEAKLGKEDCERIDCCRIREALAYMECEVADEVEVGDHTMFVGRVVKSAVKKRGKRVLQLVGGFTTTAD